MKVVSVIGLLGAGKSSLIKELLVRTDSRGWRTGVLVNESGEVPLDVPEIAANHVVNIMGGG